MNKVLEFIIRVSNQTGAGIRSALNGIKSFASAVGRNLANIKAGFDMAIGVGRKFASLFAAAVREAFAFEQAEANFRTLLGSIDKAKEHIAELKAFASSTPLTFDDLANASKTMLSFGIAAEEIMPSLKMLGDISLGNSQKFAGLALVFGQIKSAGRLMGQDLLQLINQGFNPLTIIAQETGKSMTELKDMMSDGAISFEMVEAAMKKATEAGGLFNGAMEESAKTGAGLVSTLKDKWADAVRTFGNAFTDAAKGGIQLLIDKLTYLIESGEVEVWAHRVANSLSGVCETIQTMADGIRGISAAVEAVWDWSGASDVWHTAKGNLMGVGDFIGTLSGGGSFGEALNAGRRTLLDEANKGNYRNLIAGTGILGKGEKEAALANREDEAAIKAQEDAIREAARERRKAAREQQKAAEASKQVTKEEKDLKQMMAEAEAKQADEKYQKEMEKYQKELAAWEEKQARLVEKEEAARRRMEEKLHNERVKMMTQEVNAWQSEYQSALSALAAAEQESAKAWGWYRDKDSLRAQLDEERADAAAEVQFAKDFERLKDKHRDWRTATDYDPNNWRSLTLDETATKRVALAREEEARARQYAQETAENTQRAADALELIQGTLEESEGGVY
jgi:tape measure domain-containing protein